MMQKVAACTNQARFPDQPMGRRSGKVGLFIMMTALAVLLVCAAAPQARADYYFLGIGNDGYISDVNGLWGAMSTWTNWSTAAQDNIRLQQNLTGSGILEQIDWLAGSLTAGDVGIFYYSGHMYSYEADLDGDETAPGATALNPYEEKIGRRGYLYDLATDDQIAAGLGTAAAGATLITIFDACHAGGMVGGTADLDTLDDIYVMAAAMETEEAYNSTPYSRFTNGLVWALGADAPADADGDGLILADEWFAYAQLQGEYRQHPVAFSSLDAGSDQPLFYMHTVPVPASCWLFLSGLMGCLGRHANKSKNASPKMSQDSD